MTHQLEESKQEIIQKVVNQVLQHMPSSEANICSIFTKQFYQTMSLEDLQAWSIEDLYGAAINFWGFIQERAPEATKVHVYNPDFETNGWQTTHTVVQVITRDMPFIVDSLRMAVHRLGLKSHLIVHTGGIKVVRDNHNKLIQVIPRQDRDLAEGLMEAPIFMEIDRQNDPKVLKKIHDALQQVLIDNRVVVNDWPMMRQKLLAAILQLSNAKNAIEPQTLKETQAFLNWVEDHHFTLLGLDYCQLVNKKNTVILEPLQDSALGTQRISSHQNQAIVMDIMAPEAKELLNNTNGVILAKIDERAAIHRDAFIDYIGIKHFNDNGEIVGIWRLFGLYTSVAYNTSPRSIPLLRHKVDMVLRNSQLNPNGHAGKILLNILETLPRDDVIQASEQELLDIAMGIYYMQDRPRIRLFARRDWYGRFVSCLVYVPKERFNNQLAHAMETILQQAYAANEISFTSWFPESSVLARIHFVLHIDPNQSIQPNHAELEQKLVEVSRLWSDDLKDHLLESFGEEHANSLFNKYKGAFSSDYQENFSSRTALYDIGHIEALSDAAPLGLNFFKPMDEAAFVFRLKVYHRDTAIALSDILPMIERLGMRVISERPYAIHFESNTQAWISDFSLEYNAHETFTMENSKLLFEEALLKVWLQEADNDNFNQLVLSAGLTWQEITILRAYAKYFKQIRFTFSQDYIETALIASANIAKEIVALFMMKFDPKYAGSDVKVKQQISKIEALLDNVTNLDQDKIIRHYLHAINATLRTNYFQMQAQKKLDYLAFKFNSQLIPGIPKPCPKFEIFVFSTRFEGVHLRGGKVARGGLRWSDRREDFRTEILGLMKAQQVKNAVIVPNGAKGGFVPKNLTQFEGRDAVMAEGVACYQLFIRALLDITDNYVQNTVVKPQHVVCFDEDDPYLVVAADKGTATFSDYANEISLAYNFWLGDAFASGGSVGYDHKKMGITARGAWESVKRHFYTLGIDDSKDDFTVVGIGDMAGDVFGNGMLLSEHIKLIAAFNHLHIFLDPNPDAKTSFKERQRLFDLPRSNWTDYNPKLISQGGGVFNRSAKSIPLSIEIRKALAIDATELEPNELIRSILLAPVDLLWSGGIGTFVKATSETNADVGDRANDLSRVNGNQLRCKVVGEGGNLGMTQLGRVEFDLHGGLLFTDFIDNCAGVNCSDHEVNIKILLNSIVAAGDLTFKQRNEILSEMTDAVAQSVLSTNIVQPRSLSYTATQAYNSVDLHIRYMHELERTGKLDRAIEFLPTEKTLLDRKTLQRGLTRPELAVLFCYSKMILKENILASNVTEEPYLITMLQDYFPTVLKEKFASQMANHPLRREILATKISNKMINEIGGAIIFRMQEETGAPISAIVRSYLIVSAFLNIDRIWSKISEYESHMVEKQQIEIISFYIRLLRRTLRWFLRNQRTQVDIESSISYYHDGLSAIKTSMPGILGKVQRKAYDHDYQRFIKLGLDKEWAHDLSVSQYLYQVIDVIEVAKRLNMDVQKVGQVYYMLEDSLELAWLRDKVNSHTVDNTWESLAREALRDDLDWQQRNLTEALILLDQKQYNNMKKTIEAWKTEHDGLISRWHSILDELRVSSSLSYTMFFVALRDLLDLTQTTMQSINTK